MNFKNSELAKGIVYHEIYNSKEYILVLEKGSKKGELPWRKAGQKTEEITIDGEIKIVSRKGHHMVEYAEQMIKKEFPAKLANIGFGPAMFGQIEYEHLDSSEMALAIITTKTPFGSGHAQEAWNIRKKISN
jgi:hypothetical protein